MGRDKRLNGSLTIEQIKDTVIQDLQPGMSLEAVEKYFTENDVEYGYYRDSGRVLAMVKNIRGGRLFIDKSAQIIVKINEDYKVSNIEVEPVFTGP